MPPAAKNHDFSDWCLKRWACGSKKIIIFRIGSSTVGLRQQKNQDFLIFRLLLNAFCHAGLRDLVESFRNHHSDLKKVQSTSSYGQNTATKKNLVPMLYIKFFFELLSKLFLSFFCDYHLPKE